MFRVCFLGSKYRTSGGGPGCLGIWSNDQRTVGTGGVLQRLVKRCLVCGHGEKEIDIISHWCFSGLLSLKHVVSRDSGSFCSGCIFTSNLNKVPKSK